MQQFLRDDIDPIPPRRKPVVLQAALAVLSGRTDASILVSLFSKLNPHSIPATELTGFVHQHQPSRSTRHSAAFMEALQVVVAFMLFAQDTNPSSHEIKAVLRAEAEASSPNVPVEAVNYAPTDSFIDPTPKVNGNSSPILDRSSQSLPASSSGKPQRRSVWQPNPSTSKPAWTPTPKPKPMSTTTSSIRSRTAKPVAMMSVDGLSMNTAAEERAVAVLQHIPHTSCPTKIADDNLPEQASISGEEIVDLHCNSVSDFNSVAEEDAEQNTLSIAFQQPTPPVIQLRSNSGHVAEPHSRKDPPLLCERFGGAFRQQQISAYRAAKQRSRATPQILRRLTVGEVKRQQRHQRQHSPKCNRNVGSGSGRMRYVQQQSWYDSLGVEYARKQRLHSRTRKQHVQWKGIQLQPAAPNCWVPPSSLSSKTDAWINLTDDQRRAYKSRAYERLEERRHDVAAMEQQELLLSHLTWPSPTPHSLAASPPKVKRTSPPPKNARRMFLKVENKGVHMMNTRTVALSNSNNQQEIDDAKNLRKHKCEEKQRQKRIRSSEVRHIHRHTAAERLKRWHSRHKDSPRLCK